MTKVVRTALALLLSVAAYLAMPAAFSAVDDWQPIDPADLALKDNPKAPGADAMVLYGETKVNEPLAYIEHYTRMKIFTKEGLKYADVEINYEKDHETITMIRGRTIHPDGSIVNFDGKTFDKVQAKGSGIQVFAKTFTLPEVQPGSIVEYKYQSQLDSQKYYIGYQDWSPQGPVFTRHIRFLIRPVDGFQAGGRSSHTGTITSPKRSTFSRLQTVITLSSCTTFLVWKKRS